MGFPPKDDRDKMRDELAKGEPTVLLNRDGLSMTDQLKYDLCEAIVKHLSKEKISQRQLAKDLGVDPARISDITKYKFQSMTIDKLLDYVEKVEPGIKISIVS